MLAVIWIQDLIRFTKSWLVCKSVLLYSPQFAMQSYYASGEVASGFADSIKCVEQNSAAERLLNYRITSRATLC